MNFFARNFALLLVASAALGATVTVALRPDAVAQERSAGGQIDYTGELIDAQMSPISGVFAMTFTIYRDQASAEAVWSEVHYASVAEGRYRVTLGTINPMPRELGGQRVFMAVSLGSTGEITRHPLDIAFVEEPLPREAIVAQMRISYADLAERAIIAQEAQSADDCVTINGRTIDEIDRYDELLTEMSTLREEVSRAARPQVSARTTTLERVGGTGGNPYTRTCPPGHVVVGMRGGAGALIDSIEIICAPLE